MSTGKHLSLEEARQQKLLDRFAKSRPEKGDKKAFTDLLGRMAKGSPPTKRKPKAG